MGKRSHAKKTPKFAPENRPQEARTPKIGVAAEAIAEQARKRSTDCKLAIRIRILTLSTPADSKLREQAAHVTSNG